MDHPLENRIMRISLALSLTVVGAGLLAPRAVAQNFPTDDAVLGRIWAEGMERSQVERLAQALMDSIGPRLTGTPGFTAAADWAIATYQGWGVTARKEPYGTWRGWRRGTSHIDLIQPRVRSLEGVILGWSPGTARGRPVEAPVILLADVADSAAFQAWLPQARGKVVAISFPQPTCRPNSEWERFAGGAATPGFGPFGGQPQGPNVYQRMARDRAAADSAWTRRVSQTRLSNRTLPQALERAGAAGILTSTWSGGYGVTRIFQARTETIPTWDLSCEDYGLVTRLAERGQGPVVRMQADAEFLGEVPTFNVVAELRGADRPEEYVLLSAHFDSWDGGSGATDNGTGTVTMMEAMRLLKAAYPTPRRTILVGLWNSEEQGLNGSRAFATDHPEVVQGLQALFNQDNGTGRVENISTQGLVEAGAFFGRWLAALPSELTDPITLRVPGSPGGGGSDHASFICSGAPAFGLGSASWDYFNYTWHTNRDTFDKVVLDNVKHNATLTAMLAYLAASDSATIPRDRRVMPIGRSGQQQEWPTCRDGARKWEP
jgi:carboxypeptidase Q